MLVCQQSETAPLGMRGGFHISFNRNSCPILDILLKVTRLYTYITTPSVQYMYF